MGGMSFIRWVPIAALALSGCYIDISEDSSGGWYADDGDAYYYEDPSTEIAATATLHRGDMGRVRGFDGDIVDVTASSYGGYGNVTVISENRAEGWAAMSVVTVEGGLDHPALVPGAHFTFDSSSYGSSPHFSVLGCSGPSNGSWEFDQGASSVEVDVVDTGTPDTVEVRYTARFESYDYETGASTPQAVQGSFRYRR